jgi:hypothetical protein
VPDVQADRGRCGDTGMIVRLLHGFLVIEV